MEGSQSFSVVYDFCSNKTSSMESLQWLNPPASCTLKGKQGLSVVPKPGSDFWCKTYRDPPTLRLSGHALLYEIPLGLKTCIAETEFHLSGIYQFDQAGIMLYMDGKHWIKSGLEMKSMDGEAAMSCVATNEHSDWSYVSWPTRDARMRVIITRCHRALGCKVEYHTATLAGGGVGGGGGGGGGGNGEWEFLRESFVSLPEGEDGVVKVGLFCAAPSKEETDTEGLEVFFKNFSIQGESHFIV